MQALRAAELIGLMIQQGDGERIMFQWQLNGKMQSIKFLTEKGAFSSGSQQNIFGDIRGQSAFREQCNIHEIDD